MLSLFSTSSSRSDRRSLIGVIIFLMMVWMSISPVSAIVLYGGPNPDVNTIVNNADSFILDHDDTATDVTLQFGQTLNESLKWIDATQLFLLSDDLDVDGNLSQYGNIFTLDSDNVGAGANVDIVANQGSDSDGTLRYNATLNQWEISNDGGAFVAIGTGSGGADAQTLDTLDSTQFLRSDATDDFTSGTLTLLNGTTFAVGGTANIGDGGDDVFINSDDWDISSAGVGSGFTGFSSSGTVSITGSLEISGNANIGDGGDDVFINSDDWDISSAGLVSGLTGITSTGSINFTSASSFSMPQAASDPLTCSIGQQYYNTTSNSVRICRATDTWSADGAAGTQYVFAYDTTTQTVASAGTFQNITFNINGTLDGWTHTTGTANFTSLVGGVYMANVSARVAKSGGANTTISIRGAINGTEIPGSQIGGTASGSSGDGASTNFIFTVSSGDVVTIQMTGGTSNVQIVPTGSGTAVPSISLSIWRMK